VAGADAAFSEDKQKVFAAAVVYDRIEKRIVEVSHAIRPIEFPYVPTFLSFREGPAVLEAVENFGTNGASSASTAGGTPIRAGAGWRRRGVGDGVPGAIPDSRTEPTRQADIEVSRMKVR
jgi:hypothetical protein